jgi:uncharacterized membrane protein
MNDQARATSHVTLRVDRIAAFSDAVLAIATTLLVLGLEIPSAHKIPEKGLPEYLLASVPSVLGYVTSFFLVSMYWLQHFVIFHYVTRANRVFIVLNGLFLLCVTFIPFPTGLQAAYRGDTLAELLYGCTHILCGLSLLTLWLYATSGHRLIAPEITPKIVTSMTRRICIAPILSAIAIAVSLFNVWLGKAIFLTIPVFYFSHHLVDAGWHVAGQRPGALPEKTP